jgi:hypothetical protein
MLERVVCDFLHRHQVPHDREPEYPFDALLNSNGRKRADWLLPGGTFVEMWGLPGNAHYADRMLRKRALAKAHHLRLIELTEADLPFLGEKLAEFMPRRA